MDDCGHAFTVFHAADLCACLPLGSLTLARIDQKCSWEIINYQMHQIACAIAGEKLPFPWESKQANSVLPKFHPIPEDEWDAWINQDWRDVDGGQCW